MLIEIQKKTILVSVWMDMQNIYFLYREKHANLTLQTVCGHKCTIITNQSTKLDVKTGIV